MKVSVVFSSLACLLTVMPSQVLGFASVRFVSNTTKNPLMVPLRLDHALGLSKGKSELDPPRGIVLNTGVGGIIFAGGLTGFLKSGSKASLIAGSTFGGLLSLSAFLISKKKSSGNTLGAVAAGFLSYVMGKKFLRSGKFMPSGFIASLGIASFVYNLVEVLLARRSPPGEGESDAEVTAEDS